MNLGRPIQGLQVLAVNGFTSESFKLMGSNGQVHLDLACISSYYDYEIWKMDVKRAFLNGFIEEEIYMDQPVGFISIKRAKVCHLHRSIYGLKQASRSWNIHFDEDIKSCEFVKNKFDACIYKKVSGSSIVFLVPTELTHGQSSYRSPCGLVGIT
ncbi:UNVERIFIED_CONTAM: hypothetical protein Slati_2501400 [Sesamum latifolium]|uniref:Reverse transcriptase Ty1/copia-type domain-containing protein n=1 Tax=Sesamum latifolium TaxID=2727402 RepID=A0AAW2WEI1_9LAMI